MSPCPVPARACATFLLALALFPLAPACGWREFSDPRDAGPDFALQGEYAAEGAPFGAQVIALGDGRFQAVLLRGGLPGEGFDRETRLRADGGREGEGAEARVRFDGPAFQATLEPGRLSGKTRKGEPFELARVERTSPTLGAAPPDGATVLFDGSGTDHLVGNMDERGFLEAGAVSLAPFGDVTLHLEYRTPFVPTARGQMRGNSGVYLQRRYEVQVLDSFGLDGADNEAGGIYQVAPPRENMAFPPLAWQTYDIVFRAARFDGDEKTENARITVRHNGVVIHEEQELPGPTGGGEAETPEPKALLLQDHGNAVVYRNIWLVPS
jgi:hypothetical protein